MSMPPLSRKLLTFLRKTGKRIYIITARRMISGDVLK